MYLRHNHNIESCKITIIFRIVFKIIATKYNMSYLRKKNEKIKKIQT